ncbi:MAG: hypothetical protein H6707_15655 [Deltaproteobacteria bacterium]|nr:hypothetical protein [Deltaproteobacteria bacterium]
MARRGRIHVVSHTHWDRAWYWTAEQTRPRLVETIDALLDLLESDRHFRSFTLDGHTALLADYLVMRPQQRSRIRRQVKAGRLLIGPLFVLPDLFIPRGESLLRNIELGKRQSRELGQRTNIAYLPDPFGLPAQLPQILARCGLHGVLFSRGMGDEGPELGSDFFWQAPDGSHVLATHQMGGGYCNFAQVGDPRSPGWKKQATQRLRALTCELDRWSSHGVLLFNNGCDHLPAEPTLSAALATLSKLADRPISHSSFAAYHHDVRRQLGQRRQERVFVGELRGSRYANILSGVLSARVDLKLANDLVERTLLFYVEPLLAQTQHRQSPSEARTNALLLQRCWEQLLLCQPHDDICGCSIDAVHDDDLNRFARCQQILSTLVERALLADARRVRRTPVFFNPHPFDVLLTGRAAGTSGVARLRALSTGPAQAMPLKGDRLVHHRRHGTHSIANRLLEVRVSPSGQIDLIDRQRGWTYQRALRLVDDADAGDTYDFSPVANQRPIRTKLLRCQALAQRASFATLRLVYRLSIPHALNDTRSQRAKQSIPHDVELTLALGAHSPQLTVEIVLTNRADDHRLSLHVRTPYAVTHAIADGNFALQKRSIFAAAPAANWAQPPATEHPFCDLVAMETEGHGLTVCARGLRSYRLLSPHELAITLFRSVRWLSRADLSTRSGLAGPAFTVEGARLQRRLAFQLALCPYDAPLVESDAFRISQVFAAPPWQLPVQQRTPQSPGPTRLSPTAVRLSSMRPNADGTVDVVLVNYADRPLVARLDGPYRPQAKERTLDGMPVSGPAIELDHIPLHPAQIMRLRLFRS